jgi:glycosyltransferase involved in cell wall biosynthesis
MQMRILMVLENSFPPDERVENEIDILLKYGFQITLVCRSKDGNNGREVKGNLEIIRIPLPRFIYKSGAVALEFPFYFNFWRKHLSAILSDSSFDAIHLHDLPLVRVCSALAKKRGLPLICDYHENRPEIMRMYHHVNSFPGRCLISVNRWLKYQEKETPKDGHLILVTDEAREYYVNNYGFDAGKITVLPNYIVLERFGKMIPAVQQKNDESVFTVAYFGDTGLRRGTLTILQAAEKLKEKNVRFIIIGTSREQSVIEREAQNRKLDNVKFLGWKQPSEAMKLISMADIGICPFLRNIHHDTTYANKMFQYMALGKPVIVSDCTAQAAFVTKEKCGLVFEAGDAEQLCEKIIQLKDKSEYSILSRNALACVTEKYNWENYGKKLVEIYSGFQKK